MAFNFFAFGCFPPLTKEKPTRHGFIKNLDMPAMSMVFNLKDVTLLEKVKVGDKVKFSAEKLDGAFFVTSIYLTN